MAKPYTQEEVDYLNEHYALEGAVYCAEQLGRNVVNVRAKARLLGLRYIHLKDRIEASRSHKDEQRVKADTSENCDESELQEIMRKRIELDNGKVRLQLDAKTIVLVDKKKATKEHVAHLRKIINKPMRLL